MKYRISFICDESDTFRRDVLIDEEATLLDLSNIILKACGYPDDQMTSFFMCTDSWERREEITRMDCRESGVDEDVYTMADTSLTEFLDEGVTRMEYVFDPFNERTFSLRVMGEEPGHGEAEIIRSEGKAPQQVCAFDADAPLTGTTGDFDFSDDFNDDSFDAGELDPEGFEVSENF